MIQHLETAIADSNTPVPSALNTVALDPHWHTVEVHTQIRKCIAEGHYEIVRGDLRDADLRSRLEQFVAVNIVKHCQACDTDRGTQRWTEPVLAADCVAIDFTEADELPCDPKGELGTYEDDDVFVDFRAYLVGVAFYLGTQGRWALYQVEVV